MNHIVQLTLTPAQKSVLTWMRRERLGAVLFEGAYVWPAEIRRDPDLADRFLARCTGGYETEVVRR